MGDVIARNKITNVAGIRVLVRKMAESVCRPISYNRINNLMSSVGGKLSLATTIKYVNYCEEAWLLLRLRNYATTLAEKDKLEDKVYCIYISPLKALDNDIEKNLDEPLKGIEEIAGRDLGIRKAVRTGDTTQYQRQKMLKKPPHILITTPETLSILLVAPKFSNNPSL